MQQRRESLCVVAHKMNIILERRAKRSGGAAERLFTPGVSAAVQRSYSIEIYTHTSNRHCQCVLLLPTNCIMALRIEISFKKIIKGYHK
jgi:hypothetical protein